MKTQGLATLMNSLSFLDQWCTKMKFCCSRFTLSTHLVNNDGKRSGKPAELQDHVYFDVQKLRYIFVLIFKNFLSHNPESSIFRDAIYEWRWFNVSYSGEWTIPWVSSKILCSWSCMWTKILTSKWHHISVCDGICTKLILYRASARVDARVDAIFI